MIYRWMLVVCAALLMSAAKAQVANRMVSNPYTGLSAMGRFQGDVFSFLHNQAVLPFRKELLLGAAAEQRFLLNELRLYRLASQFPLYKGVAGIQGYFTNTNGYSAWMCGLAYGMKLNEKIALGTQFNMYQQQAAGYLRLSSFNFNLSLLASPFSDFRAGIQINNAGSFFSADKLLFRLPYSYEVAFGYDVSASFFVGCAFTKEENQPLSINAGISYQCSNHLNARFGFVSDTGSCYGGAGISWEKMSVSVNCSYHPVLGFTPGVQWSTAFKH